MLEKPCCVACELKRISGEIETCLQAKTVDEKQLAVWGTEFYQLIANHPHNRFIPAKNVAAKLQNKVNRTNCSGIFTGIEEFDRHTGGFAKGELVLLGSCPSIGKTSFAVNIAYRTCVEKIFRWLSFLWSWTELVFCSV